jgi:hypothetical protein
MDIYDYGMPKNALVMDDSLWQRGKSKKNNLVLTANNDLVLGPNLSSIKIPPDWDRIPSKAEKMSEEEFEEAIARLAREDAKRGAEMRDAAKGMQAGEEIRIRMLTSYISVVSPDRKAFYEKYGGIGNSIQGDDGKMLMQRDSSGKWQAGQFTEDELARASKFYEIYRNAYAEYEAEFGAVQTSKTTNAYNSYGAYSTYNVWA